MLKGAASKVIVVRRAVPSLVALTAAMLVAIGVAVLATLESAQATFPGENGRIAFSDLGGNSGNDFEIYTMLPDGTAVRQVTNKAGRDQMPSWSPDGTKIGWVRGEGNQEFWVHDVETGRQRKIVSIEDGIDSAVVWSPDGSKLAYTSQTPRNWGPTDIFVMNAHGTNQRRLTSTRSVWEWNVTWSPDGSKLAFTRHPIRLHTRTNPTFT
jgi:TolB protein